MKHRRSVRVLFLSTLLVFALPLAAQGTPARAGEAPAVARDIAGAGNVRLQAQRVAKLYQQAGLGLNAPAATRQIGEAVAQTDAELKRLERYGRKPAIQRTYARSETAWQELRATVYQPYSPATAERASQLAEELTIHSGKLALQIESEAETPAGRLIDGSARLNMLAQRLARLYLQAQAGDRSHGLLVDLEQTRKEFATGLQELATAPENSPASRDALGLARNQWIFFDSAVQQLRGKGADGKGPQNVATTSERIQETLAAVTVQYVQDFPGAAGKAR
ncbi:type IV pili methyl-accepting chemotaxis transducer N-terminal domain-containing protein [Dechloromonas sp. H13]|uniref:type IV pili methyl-accepting chemotaxis transducer N-terminal domain-containing protein n=1 Tax=Dechloromonas sp. H13 TaxID=2570193 RepID=UPI0012916A2B|nr:type IV pili methyl-accepting chemotaxis transducer N-terminal domain-containing protein [Dechloromonas sp. H13]